MDVSSIIAAEVEGEVPRVIKRNGLVSTVTAGDSGKKLSREVVTDHRVFPFSIVVPPLLALYRLGSTI